MKIIVVVSRCIHVESSCRICRVEYYVSRGHHGENPWQGSQRGILTYQIFRSSLPLFFLCFLPICSTAYLAKPDSYIFCLVLFLWQLFFLIFFFFAHTDLQTIFLLHCPSRLNPWNPGGSFMVQKMAITSPIPVFYGLTLWVRVAHVWYI